MPHLSKTVAALMLCAAAATSRATPADNPSAQTLAPEFTGIDTWLNTAPLTLRQLRGKVVLIDFWTYTCINCIHTLPYVERWHEKYKDQGLVVIGVHTPEYPFERSTDNVRAAIRHFNLRYPVAQDNDYATWRAYQNRYWPAFYLLDQTGHIVYSHFGEGEYAETEAQIQRLLAKNTTPPH